MNEVYQEQRFTVPATNGPSRLRFAADYQFTGQTSLMHIALLELLRKDTDVTRALSTPELETLFDLNYHLKEVDTIFDRVFGKT